MKKLTIALAQVNQAVGALIPNAVKIVRTATEAVSHGAQVVVFPELSVSGYPPEDLVIKRHFLQDCAKQVQRLATELPKNALIIVGTPLPTETKACNAAVVFAGGRIVATYAKMALPNYGVFDEKRVFDPGPQPMVLNVGGIRIGLHICEDSWAVEDAPCTALQNAGLDALVNLSASPYHRGKLGLREGVLRRTAGMLQAPLLYCNIVGGQDELVFDGASMALGANGKLLARASQFDEDLLFVQIPIGTQVEPSNARAPGFDEVYIAPPWPDTSSSPAALRVTNPLEDLAEVYAALTLGLRDYVDKNGFSKVVVALSGGIDSALVAALAVDALGKNRVAGITMPSKFSSDETLSDALLVARNLGIECSKVPIQHLQETYLSELEHLWKNRPADITEENLQARIRGNIVMALSNKFGWLVLTTGNKSELATGYCTLYGDMVGGFAVIKDVPKTLVFELAKWRNAARGEVIPPATIARPPTAELRADQKDTDSLPPYDVLDPILERYIECDKGIDDIVADGFAPDLVRKVIRMVDRNEYKRRQGAPGIKITPKAFGRDRRMPITNLYSEQTRPQ